MTPIQIIVGVVGLVKFLTSGVTLNHEAEVASAIKAVERKVGLTQDVKWAWNWYDWRYKDELGKADEVWDGRNFCYYAGTLIKAWYDLGHWQDCLRKALGRVEYYVGEAIRKYELEHPGDVGYETQPWYLKYLPYGLMAGLSVGLIALLLTKRRK